MRVAKLLLDVSLVSAGVFIVRFIIKVASV